MFARFFIPQLSPDPTLQSLLLETENPPELSLIYKIYYYLRRFIPLPIRHLLQRTQQKEAAEKWYLPEEFQTALVTAISSNGGEMPILNPWPGSAKFAFVLTHDVETEIGYRQIERIANLEEALGFRSSWNIVPKKYKLDQGFQTELQNRGFEIGIHGYNHDGKLYFSKRRFGRRAQKINTALNQMNATGFRSPMFHRNLEWLQSLNLSYDSSCFDVDPFQPMPGGVGSIWPFVVGDFVELPCTIPQDHVMFYHLGLENIEIWREKLNFIIQNRGLALALTHPDYLIDEKYIDLYRQFLEHVKNVGNYYHALPREVAEWWQKREATSFVRDDEQGWKFEGPAAQQASVLSVRVAQNELIFE